MSATFTATPLPDLGAVRLEVDGLTDGPVSILRTDRNGVAAVRQLPDQVATSGRLAVVDYEPALSGPVRYDVDATEASRTNAVTNPSFETDTTGWTSSGGLVIARETTGGVQGPALAYLSGGAASALFYPTVAIPAQAGQTWTVSVYVKGTAGTTVSLALIGYAASGASVSPFTYVPFTLDGTWQRISQTATLPATSTGLRPVLSIPAAAQQLRVDGVMAEREAIVRPYIEGIVPGGAIALNTTVELVDQLPVVTIPIRPQQRASALSLVDYAADRTSGTIRHTILGAELPVLILRPLSARTGVFAFRLATLAEANALVQVLEGADIALVRQASHDGMDAYVGVDSAGVGPVDDGTAHAWVVTVRYTEAPAPVGGLLGAAAWTVADVVNLGLTVGQLPGTFPTVYALAVGP